MRGAVVWSLVIQRVKSLVIFQETLTHTISDTAAPSRLTSNKVLSLFVSLTPRSSQVMSNIRRASYCYCTYSRRCYPSGHFTIVHSRRVSLSCACPR
ncbi:hypothetical protein P692DRAFT_20340988 [Suillus brevipes Sb2]|nr:hypothetical protein P692DRAFT_20340988 [Suillus brevipes Sb2]